MDTLKHHTIRLDTLKADLSALESDTPQLEQLVKDTQEATRAAKAQRSALTVQLDREARCVASERLLEAHKGEITALRGELETLELEHTQLVTLNRIQTLSDRLITIHHEAHEKLTALEQAYRKASEPHYDALLSLNLELQALHQEFFVLRRQKIDGERLEDSSDFDLAFHLSDRLDRLYPPFLPLLEAKPPQDLVNPLERSYWAERSPGIPAVTRRGHG